MKHRVLVCLVAWILAFTALGQELDPVKWTGRLEPANPHPGSTAKLILSGTIEKGWHVYSMTPVPDGPFPTTVEAKANSPKAVIGKPEQPDPIKKRDENFQRDVEYYEGKVEFSVPVTFDKTLTGPVHLDVTVTYQTCTEGKCLNPTPKSVSVDATVAGAVEVTASQPPKSSAKPQSAVEKAKSKGLLAYLLFAIASGVFSLVTPCVFPMIPITVSFFSKKKSTESPREGLKHALWYVGGIIFTFTALGVAVAAIFGATGIQTLANNPYLNIALFVLFVALSLSLFGVFEIGVPSSIASRFDGTTRAGFLGPVFMGLTFSLTSFTCTLPFVGAVLVTASQGDILWPVVGMLGFSTAFATPFFLLALFPQWLARLPKSGAWLATTKAYMGFVELAAAVKFLSTVDLGIVPNGLGIVTREVFLSLWIVLAVLAGAFMLGWIKLPKVSDAPKIGPVRLAIGIATILSCHYLISGINGGKIGNLEAFLPPSPYPGRNKSAMAEDGLKWTSDLAAAKAESQKTGKPIFIDFTGIYCTNCRWMERNMFPDTTVHSKLEKYILVRLFTDRPGNASDQANLQLMRELTNAVALPSYATLDTKGTLVDKAVYTTDRDDYLEFLSKALAKQ